MDTDCNDCSDTENAASWYYHRRAETPFSAQESAREVRGGLRRACTIICQERWRQNRSSSPGVPPALLSVTAVLTWLVHNSRVFQSTVQGPAIAGRPWKPAKRNRTLRKLPLRIGFGYPKDIIMITPQAPAVAKHK